MRAGGFGFFHQRGNRPPGLAGPVGIDAVETEHHRGVQHVAFIVPDLVTRAGPGGEVAVAGTIDEDIRAHRLTPGFCLDEQRVDALVVMHRHAGAECMEQDIDLVGGQEIIGRDLVGRGVVGLRQDLAEHQMRRVQPAEPIDAIEQLGGYALHHPGHLAMDIGMQSAEVRHPRRRAHPAEKPIALDQQRAPPRTCRGDRGGNAGRSTAEHGDFIFAVERNLACGFFDGFFGRQIEVPGWWGYVGPGGEILASRQRASTLFRPVEYQLQSRSLRRRAKVRLVDRSPIRQRCSAVQYCPSWTRKRFCHSGRKRHAIQQNCFGIDDVILFRSGGHRFPRRDRNFGQ